MSRKAVLALILLCLFTTSIDAPPCLIIYTVLHVELGVQNTLICHVTSFYPAPVNITWNKNEQKVTEETSTSVPFPNKDGSFKQTSRLNFIPKQGDVYSCTVEHVPDPTSHQIRCSTTECWREAVCSTYVSSGIFDFVSLMFLFLCLILMML